MLTSDEIKALVDRIVDRIRPERVILFGSYAKGTATVTSDLDLMVVVETELPMTSRGEALQPMLSQFLIPVDMHFYTPEEVEAYAAEPLSFVRSVLETGRTVYQRNRRPPAPSHDSHPAVAEAAGHHTRTSIRIASSDDTVRRRMQDAPRFQSARLRDRSGLDLSAPQHSMFLDE